MCYGCWVEAGKPSAVTPKIVEAAALVGKLYERNCVGGRMHIVTDDWNIEAENLSFCSGMICEAQQRGFPKGSTQAADLEAENNVQRAFEWLSKCERATALALWCKFIDERGVEIA